ncbi:MAG: hypothetical protein EP343_09510 [Deltaproteobacteria bacterium]|nr:MAG: hypothetical protein EP343_09510 [Deltaproteobacteria bacterium]
MKRLAIVAALCACCMGTVASCGGSISEDLFESKFTVAICEMIYDRCCPKEVAYQVQYTYGANKAECILRQERWVRALTQEGMLKKSTYVYNPGLGYDCIQRIQSASCDANLGTLLYQCSGAWTGTLERGGSCSRSVLSMSPWSGCKPGLFCDMDGLTCKEASQHYPGQGDTCDPKSSVACDPTRIPRLVCDSKTLRCTEAKQVGESCSQTTECESHLCLDGACQSQGVSKLFCPQS